MTNEELLKQYETYVAKLMIADTAEKERRIEKKLAEIEKEILRRMK